MKRIPLMILLALCFVLQPLAIASTESPFQSFLDNKGYTYQTMGTPKMYAELDLDADGYTELIVYTWQEDGTKRYYIWPQASDFGIEIDTLPGQSEAEPSIYYAPERQQFVLYERNAGGATYSYYSYLWQELELAFRVSWADVDGVFSAWYEDPNTGMQRIAASPSNDEAGRVNIQSVMDVYINELEELSFQELPQ